jgi:hypothetical protein
VNRRDLLGGLIHEYDITRGMTIEFLHPTRGSLRLARGRRELDRGIDELKLRPTFDRRGCARGELDDHLRPAFASCPPRL